MHAGLVSSAPVHRHQNFGGTAVATVKRQTGLVSGERHYRKARVDGRGKAQLLVTKDDSEFKRLLSLLSKVQAVNCWDVEPPAAE